MGRKNAEEAAGRLAKIRADARIRNLEKVSKYRIEAISVPKTQKRPSEERIKDFYASGFFVKIKNTRVCILCGRAVVKGEICLTIYPFSFADSHTYVPHPLGFYMDCLRKGVE